MIIIIHHITSTRTTSQAKVDGRTTEIYFTKIVVARTCYDSDHIILSIVFLLGHIG